MYRVRGCDITQHMMQNHICEVISTSGPQLCVFQRRPFSLQRPVFLGNPVQTVAGKIYRKRNLGRLRAARVRKCIKVGRYEPLEKRKMDRSLNRRTRKKA